MPVQWKEHPSFKQYEGEAIRLLRTGGVAVQLLADQDAVVLPNGDVHDLWSSDPWMLAAQCSPEAVRGSSSFARGCSSVWLRRCAHARAAVTLCLPPCLLEQGKPSLVVSLSAPTWHPLP